MNKVVKTSFRYVTEKRIINSGKTKGRTNCK